MPSPTSHDVGDDPASLPLLERVRATLLAPGLLVDKIRPGLPWLDPLLIATAIAVVSVATIPDEFFVQPMQEAVSRRGEPVEISSSPEVIARWGRGMGMLATLATHPVVAVVLAGAITVVFGMFFRSGSTFREYMSLTAHALLIPALGTVLAILIRLAGAAGWVPDFVLGVEESGSLAMAILLSIDPFVVWMLIVIGIGVSRLDPGRSAAQAAAILLFAYLGVISAGATLLRSADVATQAPEFSRATEIGSFRTCGTF